MYLVCINKDYACVRRVQRHDSIALLSLNMSQLHIKATASTAVCYRLAAKHKTEAHVVH